MHNFCSLFYQHHILFWQITEHTHSLNHKKFIWLLFKYLISNILITKTGILLHSVRTQDLANLLLCSVKSLHVLRYPASVSLGHSEKKGKRKACEVKVTQSCLTLSDKEYTVHEFLQATIVDWVALPFSRGSSQLRDRTQFFRIVGGFFTSWATREA